MPVRRVQGPGGRIGYQWGTTGKIYTGPDAMQKAIRQGQAAYRNGYRPPAGERLYWPYIVPLTKWPLRLDVD